MSPTRPVRVGVVQSAYVRLGAGPRWLCGSFVRRREALFVVVRLTSCLTRFARWRPSGNDAPHPAVPGSLAARKTRMPSSGVIFVLVIDLDRVFRFPRGFADL